MRKLFSTGYTASAFNIAFLILRVGTGILMIHHGYDKLVHFQQYVPKFINFMGLGSSVSLSLVVFSEFFCSIFIMLGLFTRLAAIPLMISTAVAVAKGHNMDILGEGEHASLFFLIYVTIFILGPGRISVDGLINK
jgi:putative oxidoreductase